MSSLSPHPVRTHSDHESPKFRYLPTQYVEQFFADGSLLFTTYEKCRTHEDITRRDSREGKTNFYFPHAGHAVAGIQGVGKRSYMLCTSSTLNDDIRSRFEVDNWIEVVDPPAFAEAVSRVIPGFTRLQMAPCSYVAERSIARPVPTPVMPDPALLVEATRSGVPGAVEEAFHAMKQQMAARLEYELGDTAYFLKEADPYAVEDEFRFVWTVDYEVRTPAIFRCPDAAQFCRPGRSFQK